MLEYRVTVQSSQAASAIGSKIRQLEDGSAAAQAIRQNFTAALRTNILAYDGKPPPAGVLEIEVLGAAAVPKIIDQIALQQAMSAAVAKEAALAALVAANSTTAAATSGKDNEKQAYYGQSLLVQYDGLVQGPFGVHEEGPLRRPHCTDLSRRFQGCQRGFELWPGLWPYSTPAPTAYSTTANEQTTPTRTGCADETLQCHYDDQLKLLPQLSNLSISPTMAARLWDPADPLSFLHPDGFVAWTEGMAGCASSDPATGKCLSVVTTPSITDEGTAAIDDLSVQWENRERVRGAQALAYLVTGLSVTQNDTIRGIDTANISTGNRATGLDPRVVKQLREVWLVGWMDNQALHRSRYMMGGLVDDKGYRPVAITDYGYMQMGSAAVTRRSFFPSVGETWHAAVGVDSVTFVDSRTYFGLKVRTPKCPLKLGGGSATCCDRDRSCTDGDDDWCCGGDFYCSNNGLAYATAKGGLVCGSSYYGAVEEKVVTPTGFRETTAFCKYGAGNASGGSGAAQEFVPCNMSLGLPLARRLLDMFSDTALVSASVADPALKMSRGHHALLTFYDQPFTDSDNQGTDGREACEDAASTIVAEYSRTTAASSTSLTVNFVSTLPRWTKMRSSTDKVSGVETVTTTTHVAYCEDLSVRSGSRSVAGGAEWWATQIFTDTTTTTAGENANASNTGRVRSRRQMQRLRRRLQRLARLEDQKVLEEERADEQHAQSEQEMVEAVAAREPRALGSRHQRRLAAGGVGAMMGSMKQAAQYQGLTFVQGPEVLGKSGGLFTTQSAGALLVTGYEDPTVSRLRSMGVDTLLETDAVRAAVTMAKSATDKAAEFVLTAAVELRGYLSAAQFDAAHQEVFKRSLAQSLGVSTSSINILQVAAVQRRVLAGGISIGYKIRNLQEKEAVLAEGKIKELSQQQGAAVVSFVQLLRAGFDSASLSYDKSALGAEFTLSTRAAETNPTGVNSTAPAKPISAMAVSSSIRNTRNTSNTSTSTRRRLLRPWIFTAEGKRVIVLQEQGDMTHRQLSVELTAERLAEASAVLARASRFFALPYCSNHSWEEANALDQLAPGGMGRRRRMTTGAQVWHQGSVNEVKDGARPSSAGHGAARGEVGQDGQRLHGYGGVTEDTPGLAHINTLSLWDGTSVVHDWESSTATAAATRKPGLAVTGSDGSQFPPLLDGIDSAGMPIEPAMSYDVWWEEPKRPIRLSYSLTKQRFGVDVRRYVVSQDGWTRFEGPGESDEYAPVNLFDLSRTNDGVEVFMSFPHFLYGAQESIREGVGGLKPDETKHGSVYDVEPTTGMLLNMRRRYQINVRVERTKSDYQKLLTPHCGIAKTTTVVSTLSGAATSSSSGTSSDSGIASVPGPAVMSEASLVCSLFLPMYWVTHEGYVKPEDGVFLRDKVFHALTWATRVIVIATFAGVLAIAMGAMFCLAGFRDRIRQQVRERERVPPGTELAPAKWAPVALGALPLALPEELYNDRTGMAKMKAKKSRSTFIGSSRNQKPSLVAPVPSGEVRGEMALPPLDGQQRGHMRRETRLERGAKGLVKLGGRMLPFKQRADTRSRSPGSGSDADDEGEVSSRATGRLIASRPNEAEVIGTDERRQMLQQQRQ
jgi:hypothetical protein